MQLQERRDYEQVRLLMLHGWGRRSARAYYVDCGRNADAFLTFARYWLADHEAFYPRNRAYREGFRSFVASVQLRATRQGVAPCS